MALTAAEKMKKRREKLKSEGKYEEYKLKHRLEMKKHREKKKCELAQLSAAKRNAAKLEERRKTKLRVAKHRKMKEKRQTSQNSDSPVVYKTAGSLAKAVSRVKRSLPKSPRKKKCVIRKLYSSVNGATELETSFERSKSSSLALDPITVDKVKSFYERDDISRQAPGIKDVVTVKEDGVKEKVQVRHLFSSIRETHALFCSENEEVTIGKSKFSDLRPKHVKTSNKMPHNICLCKYHANFILAINALHDTFPSFQKYTEFFWDQYLCKPPTETCWQSNCENCKSKLQLTMKQLLESECDVTTDVNWTVWKEFEDGRLRKVIEDGEVEDLIAYINSISTQFLGHVYTKREQAKSYQDDRNVTLSEAHQRNVALVQVDFAENYTCFAQEEVQSYHWRQPQVSIFTCSICYHGKQRPYAIVSDNSDHTKDTIVVYMSKILDLIPEYVTEIRVWSDGPSSQFKNKYIAASIKTLQDKFNKNIIWNYFATSHGKGPVDGIGGSVKRQVRQAVLSHKEIVQNATDFCNVAKNVCNVNIILLLREEIDLINETLDTKSVFEAARTVPGISKIHAMLWKNNSQLKTFSLTSKREEVEISELQCSQTSQPNSKRTPIYKYVYTSSSEEESDGASDDLHSRKPTKESVKNGSFVLVEFPHENSSKRFVYVAICQSSVDSFGDVEVMCLKSVQDSRVFKTNESDVTFINFSQILEVLPLPEMKMKGNRFYYSFKKIVNIKEM